MTIREYSTFSCKTCFIDSNTEIIPKLNSYTQKEAAASRHVEMRSSGQHHYGGNGLPGQGGSALWAIPEVRGRPREGVSAPHLGICKSMPFSTVSRCSARSAASSPIKWQFSSLWRRTHSLSLKTKNALAWRAELGQFPSTSCLVLTGWNANDITDVSLAMLWGLSGHTKAGVTTGVVRLIVPLWLGGTSALAGLQARSVCYLSPIPKLILLLN